MNWGFTRLALVSPQARHVNQIPACRAVNLKQNENQLKSLITSILLVVYFTLAGCGSSLPKDDWVGTWVDIEDPSGKFIFHENGIMSIEYTEDGVTVSLEFAKYTVDKSTYTMKFLDNPFTREAGMSGVSVSGTWTLVDGNAPLIP